MIILVRVVSVLTVSLIEETTFTVSDKAFLFKVSFTDLSFFFSSLGGAIFTGGGIFTSAGISALSAVTFISGFFEPFLNAGLLSF